MIDWLIDWIWQIMGENDHCYFSRCSSDCKMSSEQVIISRSCQNLNCTFCMTIILIVLSLWENKQTWPRFLALANFIHCLFPEKPRDIINANIPPILRGMQRWQVSWIRSISQIVSQTLLFQLTKIRWLNYASTKFQTRYINKYW